MSQIHSVLLEDADGTAYTILIESTSFADVPDVSAISEESDRESYGFPSGVKSQLSKMHGTIRAYSWQVIGAFRKLPKDVEVEEVNLKFGMKIGGKAGLPIFTEGIAESNFEVSVKCKFPSRPD
ncbi:MAG: CU044_2847 family protein [Cyanobacteria bacterium J06555_13]